MNSISASFFRTYAGVPGADIDLNAASARATTGPFTTFAGESCVAIRCDTAGNLMVIPERGGAAQKLIFAAGETQYVRATKIVASGSTAGDVTVFWA